MSACNFCVVCDLGNDVWKKIRSSYLGSVVKFRGTRANGGEGRRKRDKTAYVLVGILDADPKRPMFVRVVGNADLGSAGVGQADADVLILVISDGQFGGIRTNSDAVGGQPTPGLSAENFPLAALETHKAKAHPKRVAVHGLINIGRIIAAKVRFAVAGHIRVADFVCDPYVEAGKLCGETILAKVALGRVVERYSSVVRSDIVLGIGGAKYIFNVHETTESNVR